MRWSLRPKQCLQTRAYFLSFHGFHPRSSAFICGHLLFVLIPEHRQLPVPRSVVVAPETMFTNPCLLFILPWFSSAFICVHLRPFTFCPYSGTSPVASAEIGGRCARNNVYKPVPTFYPSMVFIRVHLRSSAAIYFLSLFRNIASCQCRTIRRLEPASRGVCGIRRRRSEFDRLPDCARPVLGRHPQS